MLCCCSCLFHIQTVTNIHTWELPPPPQIFFFFLLRSFSAATGADAGRCKRELKTFVMVQGDATPTDQCLHAAGSNNIQKHVDIKKQGGKQFRGLFVQLCSVLYLPQESLMLWRTAPLTGHALPPPSRNTVNMLIVSNPPPPLCKR